MELVIDIGNSFIKCAWVDLKRRPQVLKCERFTSKQKLNFASFKNPAIKAVVICSVVPSVTKKVKPLVKQITSAKIYEVKNLKKKVKLNQLTAKENEIGSDLFADLVGARYLYGMPAVIFDIGTVAKVLGLDHNNHFIGASFLPGSFGAVQAMNINTASLPTIKLIASRSPIGKDTHMSINNGVIYSLVYAIEGFTRDYTKALKAKPKVIITGGGARLIVDKLKNVIYNPHLTLIGSDYIYQENL
ncbi:MAG: type III pantothenate kinase [Bacilli bacterium]|nr:type III pantothenate kinase [Bacilli bacterium]